MDAQGAVALQREHAGGAGRARGGSGSRVHRASTSSEVLAARELAYEGLAQAGHSVLPEPGEFRLFHAGDRAIPIRDALRERGVLVRDRSYEIPGCVRVTIGTREQIERFLDELETLWTR